jgi:ubiquinone/menaquinone biosynthesis C-methylase UbiE
LVEARVLCSLRISRFDPGPREPAQEGLAVDFKDLNRNQYKSVWNRVSTNEADAKMAVSGYVDEEMYRTTGEGSRNMLQYFVGVYPTDVVLEIGAGVGRVGAMLAPLCKEWIGLDVSENMLEHIRNRLAKFNNVRTVAGNGFDLSVIPDQSIDMCYCSVVFMHLEEWERFNYIREGFRVLRPGGRMLVDNVDITSDMGWNFFLDHCKIPPAERPPHMSKTSTPEELRTYFLRAGFGNLGQHRADYTVFSWGTKPAQG